MRELCRSILASSRASACRGRSQMLGLRDLAVELELEGMSGRCGRASLCTARDGVQTQQCLSSLQLRGANRRAGRVVRIQRSFYHGSNAAFRSILRRTPGFQGRKVPRTEPRKDRWKEGHHYEPYIGKLYATKPLVLLNSSRLHKRANLSAVDIQLQSCNDILGGGFLKQASMGEPLLPRGSESR